MNKKLSLFSLLAMTIFAAYAENVSKYQEESRAVAMPFLKQLAAENRQAINEGGPESAMAGDISRQNGWKLTRVSLKVRNPLLGTPDAWEQKNLQEFETLAAKGEKAETMEVSEIVQEPAGKSYRNATRVCCMSW